MIIPVASSTLYIGPSSVAPNEQGLFTSVLILPNTYIGTYVGKYVNASTYFHSCTSVEIREQKDRFIMKRTQTSNVVDNELSDGTRSRGYLRGDPCPNFPGDELLTVPRSTLLSYIEKETEIIDTENLSVQDLIDELIYIRRKYLSSYPFNRPEDCGLHSKDKDLLRAQTDDDQIYIDPTDENGCIDPEDYFHVYPCFINEPNYGMVANVYIEETAKRNCDYITAVTLNPGTELLVVYD